MLHDSLRAFLKSNSHSLKRHVWSTAGSPAALEAWTGTTASIQVGERGDGLSVGVWRDVMAQRHVQRSLVA